MSNNDYFLMAFLFFLLFVTAIYSMGVSVEQSIMIQCYKAAQLNSNIKCGE